MTFNDWLTLALIAIILAPVAVAFIGVLKDLNDD